MTLSPTWAVIVALALPSGFSRACYEFPPERSKGTAQ